LRLDQARRDAGMTSVMLVMLLGQPRIFTRCRATACCRRCSARAPEASHALHRHADHGRPRGHDRGPVPVDDPGELVSIGTLLAFTTVCIGVLVLRYTRPDLKRPFRVPAPWFVCISGAV
jgi:APA family basic amino acid/polyamine antiporter